jgi:hypothetical protein
MVIFFKEPNKVSVIFFGKFCFIFELFSLFNGNIINSTSLLIYSSGILIVILFCLGLIISRSIYFTFFKIF